MLATVVFGVNKHVSLVVLCHITAYVNEKMGKKKDPVARLFSLPPPRLLLLISFFLSLSVFVQH